MTKKRVREIALDILDEVEKDQSYSNLLLDQMIKKYQVTSRDRGLLTELCYGTLQRQITLDFYIAPFIRKQKKIDSWVRNLLRLSVYQFVYLTKIPDRAIIHEAVEIAKKRGHRGIGGFINGVLRAMQREGFPDINEIKDPIERLAVATSHPFWLVNRWVAQYGWERTKAMCEENLRPARQTARVNMMRTTREGAQERLTEEGFSVEPSAFVPVALKSVKGNLAHSSTFREGLITIQDESSMLVGFAVGPEPHERILDACAAPGGKTTHLSELMDNTGKIHALDIHPHKVKLIEENARRLHLTNISTKAVDARKAKEEFVPETFDRVLVDAPCSGFGVLKRKPDIKYRKTEADIEQLARIQLEILSNVAPLVKKGGILVYSTCTVDKKENHEVARHFLETHHDFDPDLALKNRLPEKIRIFVKDYYLELLPQDIESDGFFIASFRKKE